jgi:cold shock CspA family protein
MRGTMLWFNQDKNHGFISTEEGERLYVHGTGFLSGQKPASPCAGTPVDFQVSGNGNGRKAVEVSLVAEVSPRRARRRHGRGH